MNQKHNQIGNSLPKMSLHAKWVCIEQFDIEQKWSNGRVCAREPENQRNKNNIKTKGTL